MGHVTYQLHLLLKAFFCCHYFRVYLRPRVLLLGSQSIAFLSALFRLLFSCYVLVLVTML